MAFLLFFYSDLHHFFWDTRLSILFKCHFFLELRLRFSLCDSFQVSFSSRAAFKVFSLSWFHLPYFEVPLCGFLSIYPACGSKDFLNLLLDFFHQFGDVLGIGQPFGRCSVPFTSSAPYATLITLTSVSVTLPCIIYASWEKFSVLFFSSMLCSVYFPSCLSFNLLTHSSATSNLILNIASVAEAS